MNIIRALNRFWRWLNLPSCARCGAKTTGQPDFCYGCGRYLCRICINYGHWRDGFHGR